MESGFATGPGPRLAFGGKKNLVFGIAYGRGLNYNAVDMWQLGKEFLLFLKQEKKWWLVPLVVILLALGALIVFSSGSVLAPLMYPFM